MSDKEFNFSFFDEDLKKENFQLYLSIKQKKALSDFWFIYRVSSSKVISIGINEFPDIAELPLGEGPFTEKFNVKAEPEMIQKLDLIAKNSDCSKAEIARRIINKATVAFDEEMENLRKTKRPFSELFDLGSASINGSE